MHFSSTLLLGLLGRADFWRRLSAQVISNSRLFLMGLLLTVGAMIASPVWAATSEIAVIFPALGQPYREIFDKIMEGIDKKMGMSVPNYAVSASTDINELREQLLSQHVGVVIALGRQGMKVATQINNDIGVVVGGVLAPPESKSRRQQVVSLTPDPELLFKEMKLLQPETRRIFVVYNPDLSGWLIKLAQAAAQANGLELVAYKAESVRSAGQYYKKVLAQVNTDHDVIWLLQDSVTAEESSIIPMILQRSWQKRVAVFSSNFTHVRRGALFSLYPDNEELGKSLAGFARLMLKSTQHKEYGMLPLYDVRTVGNLRTAKHLGISQQNFDMKFAE